MSSRTTTPIALLVILFLAFAMACNRQPTNTDERTPEGKQVAGYELAFFEQWIREHEAYPYECWTDSGYDPNGSTLPRDIQILCAMDYGKCDIDNGGFHQFFSNSTGVFAPEMVEWCQRAGLPDVAEVMQEAMAKFGDSYPRSRKDRHAVLEKYPAVGDREDWDPFYKLHEEFFAILSNNGSRYEDAADKWLREVCGISDVSDAPKNAAP